MLTIFILLTSELRTANRKIHELLLNSITMAVHVTRTFTIINVKASIFESEFGELDVLYLNVLSSFLSESRFQLQGFTVVHMVWFISATH